MKTMEFKYLLLELTRKINDGMNIMLNDMGSRYGLSALQLRVVTELYKEGSLPIGVLANNTLIAGANLTSICKKLETMGHVVRYRDPEDDRRVKISLTETGLKIAGEMDRFYTAKMERISERKEGKSYSEIIAAMENVVEILTLFNEKEEGEA